MTDELLESIVLIQDALNDSLYKLVRYQKTGFDHSLADAVERLEAVRDLANETIEEYENRGENE